MKTIVAAIAIAVMGMIGAFQYAAGAEIVVPAPHGFVTDETGLLSQIQRAELSSKLSMIQQKGVSAAVLMPKSMQGADMDTYRHAVAEKWRIGKAGIDNGLLIVLAPVERKIGFEVGYGIEGTITDSLTRTWSTQMKPHLVKGNEQWFQALLVPVNGLVTVTAEPLVKPQMKTADAGMAITIAFFLVCLFSGIAVWYDSRVQKRRRAEADARYKTQQKTAEQTVQDRVRRGDSRAAMLVPGMLGAGMAAAATAAAMSRPKKWSDPPPPKKKEPEKKSSGSSHAAAAVAGALIGSALGSDHGGSSYDSGSSSGGSFDTGGSSGGGGSSDSF